MAKRARATAGVAGHSRLSSAGEAATKKHALAIAAQPGTAGGAASLPVPFVASWARLLGAAGRACGARCCRQICAPNCLFSCRQRPCAAGPSPKGDQQPRWGPPQPRQARTSALAAPRQGAAPSRGLHPHSLQGRRQHAGSGMHRQWRQPGRTKRARPNSHCKPWLSASAAASPLARPLRMQPSAPTPQLLCSLEANPAAPHHAPAYTRPSRRLNSCWRSCSTAGLYPAGGGGGAGARSSAAALPAASGALPGGHVALGALLLPLLMQKRMSHPAGSEQWPLKVGPGRVRGRGRGHSQAALPVGAGQAESAGAGWGAFMTFCHKFGRSNGLRSSSPCRNTIGLTQ